MKRTLRRWLPIIAAVGVLIALTLLLTVRPWSDGPSVEEAAASTVQHRLCDTVLEAPLAPRPLGEQARDIISIAGGVDVTETHGLEPSLEVHLKLPSVGKPSSVSIDPMTATVLEERYSSPAHEALLRAVTNTARLEPLEPDTAPWPYTDKTQVSPRQHPGGAFSWRLPDPGSGLVMSAMNVSGDLWGSESMQVANCRSFVRMTWTFGANAEQPGLTITRDVHPEDEAAFETFLDTVVVRGVDQ